MEIKSVKIDLYDWDVNCIFLNDEYNDNDVVDKVCEMSSSHQVENARVLLRDKAIKNNAVCSTDNHNTLVVFMPFSDDNGKINTITHELRHVVDDMCLVLGINDTEAAAYLTGYIGERIWK
jgi:hypothetical protein